MPQSIEPTKLMRKATPSSPEFSTIKSKYPDRVQIPNSASTTTYGLNPEHAQFQNSKNPQRQTTSAHDVQNPGAKVKPEFSTQV